jgi:hypothetical protein
VTSAGLAGLSNDLLYSAMAVYALAMYFFAAELAFSRPVRQGRRAERFEERQLAAVGGGGSVVRARRRPRRAPPRTARRARTASGGSL